MADTGEMRAIDWEQCPIGSRIEATQAAQTARLGLIHDTQNDMAADVRKLLLSGAQRNGAVAAGKSLGKALWLVLLAAGGAAAWFVGYMSG